MYFLFNSLSSETPAVKVVGRFKCQVKHFLHFLSLNRTICHGYSTEKLSEIDLLSTHSILDTRADPEGGTGGPNPHLKILLLFVSLEILERTHREANCCFASRRMSVWPSVKCIEDRKKVFRTRPDVIVWIRAWANSRKTYVINLKSACTAIL